MKPGGLSSPALFFHFFWLFYIILFFHKNILQYVHFYQNTIGIFYWDFTECIKFGRNIEVILLLRLPIHGHHILLYLFRSSSVSSEILCSLQCTGLTYILWHFFLNLPYFPCYYKSFQLYQLYFTYFEALFLKGHILVGLCWGLLCLLGELTLITYKTLL